MTHVEHMEYSHGKRTYSHDECSCSNERHDIGDQNRSSDTQTDTQTTTYISSDEKVDNVAANSTIDKPVGSASATNYTQQHERNGMSKADTQFIRMCSDIIEHGTTNNSELVRPHWEDGTPAYTIKQFGVCNRYDLREEFPALTLRRTALKSAMDEVLWIYQKKSNNIHDLKSHIWDQWADETGSIGKAYGYQIAQVSHYPEGDMDQMDKALYDLKHTPFSRRIITNMYTFADLSEMHLYPCAYSVTYNVTQGPNDPKPVLNMLLMQRSQDILAANNWNVAQYAILLMMVAQTCKMQAGQLVHIISDAHIYDRHIPIIKELITRPTYPAPSVTLNPEIDDFYAFTTDDLIVENYQHGPQVKNIPIAI